MKPPASNTAKSGNCSFGPDLTFVGVKLTGQFCSSWYYSPASVQPANLYKARRVEGRVPLRAKGGCWLAVSARLLPPATLRQPCCNHALVHLQAQLTRRLASRP